MYFILSSLIKNLVQKVFKKQNLKSRQSFRLKSLYIFRYSNSFVYLDMKRRQKLRILERVKSTLQSSKFVKITLRAFVTQLFAKHRNILENKFAVFDEFFSTFAFCQRKRKSSVREKICKGYIFLQVYRNFESSYFLKFFVYLNLYCNDQVQYRTIPK